MARLRKRRRGRRGEKLIAFGFWPLAFRFADRSAETPASLCNSRFFIAPLVARRAMWHSFTGLWTRLRFGHSWHALSRLVGQAIVPAGGLQAAVDTEQTTHAVGTYFLRLRVSPASCREAREMPDESRGRLLGTARMRRESSSWTAQAGSGICNRSCARSDGREPRAKSQQPKA
jgi:hypothetical protein